MPESAADLLKQLREVAAGDSLFSDQSDSISYLLSHQIPFIPPTADDGVKNYATLLLGVAVTLSSGWSILPPGVSSDITAHHPSPEAWREAVGQQAADQWMTLAAWVGAEVAAQAALPLPYIPSVDADALILAALRWNRLIETMLAPAVDAYQDHADRIGVSGLLSRAAVDLSSGGKNGDLWEWNRDNRVEILRHLAQRDHSLVADLFSFAKGRPSAPVGGEHSERSSRLHPGAIGIFGLHEWPLPTQVLYGTALFAVRDQLRRRALEVAAEHPHVQQFLLASGLVQFDPLKLHPFEWELSAITQVSPGAVAHFSTEESIRCSGSLFKRFFAYNRDPKDYTDFRRWAMSRKESVKSIPTILLMTDAKLIAEWAVEVESLKLQVPSENADPRLRSLEEAISIIGAPEQTLDVVNAALQVARESMDGDQAVRLVEVMAHLLPSDQRAEAGRMLIDLLKVVNSLSPISVGILSRTALVPPHEIVSARLRRRVTGSTQEDGVGTNMQPTSQEEATLRRVEDEFRGVRGLYYVEHRMLSIIEAGTRFGLSPDPDLFGILQGFNSSGTAKGKEKETRALFALISAFDHERRDMRPEQSYVLTAVKAHPSLQLARHALEVSGQMSPHERTIRLIHEATCAPIDTFSAGVAASDIAVLATLHDAYTARTCLAGIPSPLRLTSRTVLHAAISEYARGTFQRWKYSHDLARAQIRFASPALADCWSTDQAWSGEAFGIGLVVRETSDFGELLRHADYPVKTCQSLLGFGEKMEAGLAAVVDAHSKVLLFIDPSSRRIVGRSVIRLFQREADQPLIIAEAPYTTAKEMPALAMRVLAARCLGEKFDHLPVLVTNGVSAKDRETDRLPNAERHLGRMQVLTVTAPLSLLCDHWIDSNILPNGQPAEAARDGSLDVACLMDAVNMVRDFAHITNLPDSLCPKDPPSLFSTTAPEDEEYAERCRQVFPDTAAREAYFNRHPGVRLSGTIPKGHEEAWRGCLNKFPQLANYLHHSEAVQSLIGGAPNADGNGAEIRGALAIIEGRPFFRGLIQGMARDEIAASRENWIAAVGHSMEKDPDRWPPEIDYQEIAASIKDAIPLALSSDKAFTLQQSRESRGVIPAPSPGGVLHGFNEQAGF